MFFMYNIRMNFISHLDTATLNFFESIRSPFLTYFFKAVTTLGEWWFILIIVAIISFLFFRKFKMMPVLILWLLAIGSAIDAHILKVLFHRERPIDSLVENGTFSFPSAHATLAMACYGFAIYLALKNIRREWLRKIIAYLGPAGIMLIAASRLYLGAHYLSDVVAGLLLGGAWLAIGIYAIKLTRQKKQ